MKEQEYITWLRVRLKTAHFLVIQGACIAFAIVGGILAFLFLRGDTRGLLRYAWLVFLVMFIGEVVETMLAFRRRARTSGKGEKGGEEGKRSS
jgi:hypothetical protein